MKQCVRGFVLLETGNVHEGSPLVAGAGADDPGLKLTLLPAGLQHGEAALLSLVLTLRGLSVSPVRRRAARQQRDAEERETAMR